MKETSINIMRNLKEYLMKQDHEDVAFVCASLLVDINRILNQDLLTEKEKICLIARMQVTDASVQYLIINGGRGKMQIHEFNSDEL